MFYKKKNSSLSLVYIFRLFKVNFPLILKDMSSVVTARKNLPQIRQEGKAWP